MHHCDPMDGGWVGLLRWWLCAD